MHLWLEKVQLDNFIDLLRFHAGLQVVPILSKRYNRYNLLTKDVIKRGVRTWSYDLINKT